MRIEEETRIHVKNFASESATKINFVQANHNFQNFGKNKAGNKRKVSKAATKNFGNSGMTSNSKKGKTYYNCGKKGLTNMTVGFERNRSKTIRIMSRIPIMQIWPNMLLN